MPRKKRKPSAALDGPPPSGLEYSMLARAGVLAHYMLLRGISVQVASGATTNGTPCTVILAIGDDADIAAQVGRRLVDEVGKQHIRRDDQARQN